jgi:cell wall-associated NlpC family hydrolase
MGSGRAWATAAVVAALAGSALVAPASVADEVAAPTQARVGVSVATLWASPESPRAVDARAVAAPADPAGWLRGLTTAGRRGLFGRVESQALYGQPVEVLERRGAWARVVLPTQPSPKAPGGYPGWIPAAQLVESAPSDAPTEIVVKRRTAWAHAAAALDSRVIQLSYGTRLPVTGRSGRAVSVLGPDGRTLWVSAKRVKVVAVGAPSRRPTRKAVVAEARRFLGLPYLWGGTSGFGYDCSGLTHAVYAQLGITLPRDATPQFAQGRPIAARGALRKGDLVFFRNSAGSLHHVGIYIGRGRMIHSPRTGQPVQVATIRTGIWNREFAGGRRVL